MDENRMNTRTLRAAVLNVAIAATAIFLPASAVVSAQETAARPMLGTITAIQGSTVTIKNDAGAESIITVPDGIRMVRTAPGQRTLTGATPIHISDLQVGDRILVKALPSADGKGFTASTLIAMKQADIAQKQQKEREDWQRNGTGGLVKSVDAASGNITITVSNGAAHSVTIHTVNSTVIRRYAPDSVKFDDAKPAALADIHPGDQLRARGAKNADGSEVTADEIVAGTFRNVAGTVLSVDAANNSLTINDLATKKPVTIKVTADSQMRKLPEEMARGIAMRFKHEAGANGGSAAGGSAAPGAQHQAPAPGAQPSGPPAGAPSAEAPGGADAARGPGGAAGEHHGGDLQQMLSHAPTVQLADLKKGDAVMVVTTQGSNAGAGTAVTLLAGVEPLLQASPSASQNMLSASWNLGGGGGAGAEAAQ
jgi:hypothetical protein